MKTTTRRIAIASLILCSCLVGIGGGITYAGYVTQHAIPDAFTVSVKYQKCYIYLDADNALDNGDSWETDNAVFWVQSFHKDNNGTILENAWSRDLKTDSDEHHIFEITHNVNTVIFYRFNSTDETHDMTKKLNQTDDLTWAYVASNSTQKLFTITYWSDGNYGNSGGNWSSYTPS